MGDSILEKVLRDNPIVVTGLGVFCGAGATVQELWTNVVEGRSSAVWKKFPGRKSPLRVAVCTAPNVRTDLPELHAARKMDRCVQMALAATRQAWSDAGLDENSLPPERIGIISGTSRGPLEKIGESARLLDHGRMLPSLAANSTVACLSGALGHILGVRGAGFTVSATCASAAMAIALGAQQILTGSVDVVVAGGAEASFQPLLVSQLSVAGLLGSHEDPDRVCRPFDVTRDGILLGEGAAFIVLESALSARRRGAKIHARLAGWALGIDSAGRSGVSESGEGLLQVMNPALRLAGLDSTQVDYCNTHGTGTQLNDRAEARAMAHLMSESEKGIPCSSTKPITGHCLGATPAIEAVISIQTIRHQCLPPTINCEQPDPECALDIIPDKSRVAPVRAVMSNSLGFWGKHASLIFTSPS